MRPRAAKRFDVVRVPLADVEALFTSGEIAHALTIAAFHFYPSTSATS